MTHYGIGHMIVSALVKGVIYSVIWKIMRTLTIPEALALAGGVLLVCAVAVPLVNRARRT
jgi:hypothetical protein